MAETCCQTQGRVTQERVVETLTELGFDGAPLGFGLWVYSVYSPLFTERGCLMTTGLQARHRGPNQIVVRGVSPRPSRPQMPLAATAVHVD